MRFVTFAAGETAAPQPAWRVGLLGPDLSNVIDLVKALEWWPATRDLPPASGPLAWYDMDQPWFQAARRLHDALGADPSTQTLLSERRLSLRRESCRLGSPVPRPGKLIAVGLNYRDHAAEARLPIPASPIVFAKFSSAVVGTDDAIVLPAGSHRVDYEGELAVVIGSVARRVPASNALDCVLGYMNGNDVSERDFQKGDGQWVRAKSCDTFAPLGPWLVTADEIPDPNALGISTRLNGRTVQRSSTRECVFDVARLIEFVSATSTLEPGDVILTGTPAGVGFARRPPLFLAAGDVVEVEIEGLGVLRNEVRDLTPA